MPDEKEHHPDWRLIGTILGIAGPLVATGVGTALWIMAQFAEVDADVLAVHKRVDQGFSELKRTIESEFKADARQDSLETSSINRSLGELIGRAAACGPGPTGD